MDVLREFGGLAQVTSSMVVVIGVFMLFRGLLVPWRYYNEMKDARDEWRRTAEKAQAANAELLAQQRLLLDSNLTTKHVVESLPKTPPSGG